MSKRSRFVVGLDIGTTKICTIVGEPNDDGGLDIVGIGTHPSRGLRRGVVVNVDATVESIKRSLEEAELMSGETVDSVHIGVAGSHLKGFNSRGVIAETLAPQESTMAFEERITDKQIVHRSLKDGLIDKTALADYLTALPDVADQILPPEEEGAAEEEVQAAAPAAPQAPQAVEPPPEG